MSEQQIDADTEFIQTEKEEQARIWLETNFVVKLRKFDDLHANENWY